MVSSSTSKTTGKSSSSISSRKTMITSNAEAALMVTYINIVLYALCYQLQRPVEPFLVEQLSKGSNSDGNSNNITQIYGQLQSFFSIIQTIGSPIVGILLDRLGVRFASTIVFTASAISYYILCTAATTNHISTLFYSKIPTAFQHAFLIAQAIAAIAGQGDEAIRAQALGRVTTAYTIGATIGPVLGGYLVEYKNDLYFGAKLAVLGSILSVLLSLIFLPDAAASSSSLSPNKDTEEAEEEMVPLASTKNNNHNDDDSPVYSTPSEKELLPVKERRRSFMDEMKHSIEIATRTGLWPLLVIKVISGVASSMFDTTLPIVLTQRLHYDPATLGILMSSSMISSAIFSVYGIHTITKAFGTISIIQYSLVIRPILNCLVAVTIMMYKIFASSINVTTPTTLLLCMMIVTTTLRGLTSHTLSTGLTTRSTGLVTTQEQGTLLGLEHGLFSMARIVGPTIGTFLYTSATSSSGSFWAVIIACGCTDLSLLTVLKVTTQVTNPHHQQFKNKNP